MLTKDDLNQIKQIVEPIGRDVLTLKNDFSALKNDVSTLKKDTSQIRTDVKVLISYFDSEYVELRKRVEKIEEHLDLNSKN